MKHFKIIFITLFLSFSFSANAILHVEPHLGYNLFGLGHSDDVPATTVLYNGGQYGLKLGAEYLNAMAGLDYNHSSFNQLTSGYKNDFSRNEIGVFAGYSFPAIARFWVTYFFSLNSEASSTSDLIATGSSYKGHSLELGGGYNGIPYVSFNILLRFITLNEYVTSSSTTQLSGSSEISSNELVLSVSSPFNLF